MGTSYEIARRGGVSLTINESGSKFDLELASVEDWGLDYKEIGDFSVEELRSIRDAISQILSYWGDEEEPWHPVRSSYLPSTLVVDGE